MNADWTTRAGSTCGNWDTGSGTFAMGDASRTNQPFLFLVDASPCSGFNYSFVCVEQ